jgi:putative phage-type endonuclease
MIVVSGIEQGTPEWHRLRIGNPGASGMDNIITSTGKISTSRKKYMYQMAGELLIGEKPETFKSAAMIRGNELEPEAREIFEFINGPVAQCGLIYQDERRLWHCSPDGICPDEQYGLEIKCPMLQTHIEYLDGGKLPTAYKIQVQASMMVTGWPVWWFVSYHPGIKPLIIPVERDEKLIPLIQEALEEFCEELLTLVEALK